MKHLFVILTILLSILTANAQQSTSRTSSTNRDTANRKPSNETRQAITGRIIDDAGKPVAEATVLAARAGFNNKQIDASAAKLHRTIITDNDGRFKFDELAPGAYILNATAPGYVLASEYKFTNDKPRYYRAGETVALRMVKGGVITGTVTDLYGEPIVALRVQATKVREVDGRPARGMTLDESDLTREWKTDDRGVYRIYGLEPGVYVVAAGGKGFTSFLNFIDNTSTTYFPSGTRDTATPLALQSGQELTGVDIHFRDTKGYAVSGKLTKAGDANAKLEFGFVALTSASTGNLEAWTIAGMFGREDGGDEARAFALMSVPDGDYNLSAFSGEGKATTENILVSPPRRVTVSGGDVTGIELPLYPLSTITGQFVLERLKTPDGKPACNGANRSIEEAVVFARADARGKAKTEPLPLEFSPMVISFDSTPNQKGEFQLHTFEAGRYHLETSLPSEDWYIRAITRSDATPPPNSKEKTASGQSKDGAASGLEVKLGDKIEGVRIVAAEGAAGVKGRIVAEKDGEALPVNLRVFLVPAEPESANDVVRFYEAEVQKDGAFALSSLAPGRYFVFARTISEEERNETFARPVAWDAEARARLRKDVEAINFTLDLQQCQRLGDTLLKYPLQPQAKKPEPKKTD